MLDILAFRWRSFRARSSSNGPAGVNVVTSTAVEVTVYQFRVV